MLKFSPGQLIWEMVLGHLPYYHKSVHYSHTQECRDSKVTWTATSLPSTSANIIGSPSLQSVLIVRGSSFPSRLTSSPSSLHPHLTGTLSSSHFTTSSQSWGSRSTVSDCLEGGEGVKFSQLAGTTAQVSCQSHNRIMARGQSTHTAWHNAPYTIQGDMYVAVPSIQ